MTSIRSCSVFVYILSVMWMMNMSPNNCQVYGFLPNPYVSRSQNRGSLGSPSSLSPASTSTSTSTAASTSISKSSSLDMTTKNTTPTEDPSTVNGNKDDNSPLLTGNNATFTSNSSPNTTTLRSRLNWLSKRLYGGKKNTKENGGDGDDDDDHLTFRQRLAKAGLSVILSYGWVSNYTYAITISLSWYIFNKRTNLSPLAPGQWKSYLAVYAAFYVMNNFIRPMRFAAAISLSMYLDRIVSWMQRTFRWNRTVALVVTIFVGNIMGTLALTCLGITTASMVSGVPIFPKSN